MSPVRPPPLRAKSGPRAKLSFRLLRRQRLFGRTDHARVPPLKLRHRVPHCSTLQGLAPFLSISQAGPPSIPSPGWPPANPFNNISAIFASGSSSYSPKTGYWGASAWWASSEEREDPRVGCETTAGAVLHWNCRDTEGNCVKIRLGARIDIFALGGGRHRRSAPPGRLELGQLFGLLRVELHSEGADEAVHVVEVAGDHHDVENLLVG